MNKKVKILLVLGAVLLLIFVAAYLKRNDRTETGEVNSIATIETAVGDKTFTSKLSAWDAYANEKEQYYKRGAHSFMKSAEPTSSPAAEVTIPEPPAETYVADALSATVPSDAVHREPVRQTSSRQFDAAYEEVARNMEQIYDDAPNPRTGSRTAAVLQEAPENVDATAQRREAMMRDWGMAGSQSSAAVPSGEMFRAVIHGTQTIKAGQTALFRTKEEIRYGGVVVPANTLLTGNAAISENRLTISINYVRLGHQIYPLPLEVYGSDGMPGLPLNYDAASKIANTQTSNAATQEISSAASRYGGTIGRVAGSIISGVSGQVRSLKNVEVKLIDNQSVILKIAEQK